MSSPCSTVALCVIVTLTSLSCAGPGSAAKAPSSAPPPATLPGIELTQESAARLRAGPLIAYRLSEEQDAKPQMDVVMGGTGQRAFEEVIRSAAVTAGERTVLPKLPEITSRRWKRTGVPEQGPLFDVRQVAAAYLLHRLQSGGLVDEGSVACGEAAQCGTEEFTLEVAVPREVTAVAGHPPVYSVRAFRTRARLRDAQQVVVWQQDCELSISPRNPAPLGRRASVIQGLLDAAAIECGERLFQALRGQMTGS